MKIQIDAYLEDGTDGTIDFELTDDLISRFKLAYNVLNNSDRSFRYIAVTEPHHYYGMLVFDVHRYGLVRVKLVGFTGVVGYASSKQFNLSYSARII